LAKSRLTNENIMENCKSGKPHAVSQHILAVPPPVTKNKPGGVEPTDTFQIWILRRRDSLLWLAGRGTVEERTPFRMISRNGSLERATMFRTVISRFGDIAWPARSPELTVPDF